MSTLRFRSCKIGASIPLEKPAAFFHMQRTSSWKEYIAIRGPHLETILKKKCGSQQAYLFEFGCITFVDFTEAEMQRFLEFIAGMTEPIDYSMVALFAEAHTIRIAADGLHFNPWEGSGTYKYDEAAIPLIATILAKSTALNKIEADIDANIDESGKYLEYLNKGRLRFTNKAVAAAISKFLKFEYESINHIRIFDRSIADPHSLSSRELYDAFAEYYELHDRFDVLQRKIASLRNTIKAYNSLSYGQNQNRLILFEVFLLLLFPLAGIFRMFFLR